MLYGEIRAFRHDYLNILTSLKLSIEHEDLNAIREVYENVLSRVANNFTIASLILPNSVTSKIQL